MKSTFEHHNHPIWKHPFVLASILLLVVVLIRTAWFNDDSYITFRTVDNLLHGHGATWNIAERVQTYTHPLWMLVVSAVSALTGEIYFSVTVLQILLATVAVYLAVRNFSKHVVSSCIFIIALVFSKSFIEYGTSGLENALSYLLVSLFAVAILKPRRGNQLLSTTFIASLVAINRLDLLLLVLPGIVLVFLSASGSTRNRILSVTLGLLPLITWLSFSLLYYGSLVPNTAYAKLATGIDQLSMIKQGIFYLLNSLSLDPITLMVIIGSTWLTLRHWRMHPRLTALSLGITLYTLYVVKVGGDFMSGRFLSVSFFLACIVCLNLFSFSKPKLESPVTLATLLSIVLIGFIAPRPIVLSNRDYGDTLHNPIDGMWVVDERNFYYGQTGLLTYQSGKYPIKSSFYTQGLTYRDSKESVVEFPTIGFAGYAAGPGIHILDHYALADPLLARLPIIKSDLSPSGWRIGHFVREIPCGYVDSLKTNANKICDPDLAAYYEKIRLITRGDILDPSRIRAIIGMQLGRYNHFLNAYVQKHPEKYAFDSSI